MSRFSNLIEMISGEALHKLLWTGSGGSHDDYGLFEALLMAWMPPPDGIHAINRANYWCEARADPIIRSLPVRSTHRSGVFC